MDSRDAPVVVGVKDMATDSNTVRLAAREAASIGRRLHIVHAFVWPLFMAGDDDTDDREMAARMVEEAAALARAERPGLTVSAAVVDGDPIRVLLRADAALVVLGGRGLSQVGHDPTSSVSIQVAARSARPVLFATGAEHAGPVVVGVDGSADSSVGLNLAFDEARRRRTGVVVLHAEGVRCRAEGGDDPAAVPGEGGDHRTAVPAGAVSEGVASGTTGAASRRTGAALGATGVAPERTGVAPGMMGGAPGNTGAASGESGVVRPESGAKLAAVPAEHRVVDDPADEALIAESGGAQLVVVGAQGDRPSLLGPVTQAVLRHAHCPVLVTRAPMVAETSS